LIVSAEEHAVTSGLNSVVGDFLQRNKFSIPQIKLGLPPKFLENGSYEYLMKRYELDADSIVKKILHELKQ
jgi:transketolase C-terminal domain/subunit